MGKVYDLEIPLPPSLEGVVECSCEVVWKRDWQRGRSPGMRLRFQDLPDEIAEELDRWVERGSRRIRYRADAA